MNVQNHYLEICQYTGEPFPLYGKRIRKINHLFFAKLLAGENAIKYFTNKGWMQFNGNLWTIIAPEKIKIKIRNLILHVAREYEVDIYAQITCGILEEILKMAQLELYGEVFPRLDPNIIPVKNGVLTWDDRSQQFKFSEYTPEVFVSSTLNVNYVPNAPCDFFVEKLQEIMPDEDDRRVALEYCGAALFSQNFTRKILLLQGEGGCGKTTLPLLLTSLLGQNRVFDLNIQAIGRDYELAALEEQTLLTASEAVSGVLCSAGSEFVKKIVGRDFIQTRQKFRNKRVDHFGTFSLTIVTNNRVRLAFEGRGDEWRDRLIPIFFNHHIEKTDKMLIERLLTENGPGILNCLLEAAERVRKNNWEIELSPNQMIRRDNLVAMSKPVEAFVRKYIVRSFGNDLPSQRAFECYVKVRKQSGLPSLEAQVFYKNLAKAMDEIFQASIRNSLKTSHGIVRGYRGFKLIC